MTIAVDLRRKATKQTNKQTILMVFLKEVFKKVDFENNQQTTKNMQNFQ